MSTGRADQGTDSILRELRRRADEDFTSPPPHHEQDRHRADLAELGLRVTVTRSRYPNRPDGVDQYAVTLTRTKLDAPPGDGEAQWVLHAAFGDLAGRAVERTGGPVVRMFRVPAAPG